MTLEEIIENFEIDLSRYGFNDNPTCVEEEYLDEVNSSDLSPDEKYKGIELIKAKMSDWWMST